MGAEILAGTENLAGAENSFWVFLQLIDLFLEMVVLLKISVTFPPKMTTN